VAKVTGGTAGEKGAGLLKLIVEALCRQQALLDSLHGPGKVIVHFNPQNRQEPVSLEFNFKV
jgi:hypothetical protein